MDISGFVDADQMLLELSQDFDLDQMIDAEVQRRLAALSEDMLTDPNRAREEAIAATFNDPQVRKLQVERDVLAQRALKDPIPLQAIRQRAKRIIDQTPANEVIKPGRYAMDAQNLHKRAVKMAAMGRFDEALRLTHKAMLQHELARMAYKARAERDKIKNGLKPYGPNRKINPKRINPRMIAAIRTLMSMPGAANQAEAREALLSQQNEMLTGFTYTALDENGDPVEISSGPIELSLPSAFYDGVDLPDIDNMTMEQLREFRDAIKSLVHTGRMQSEAQRAESYARNKVAADKVYDSWGKRNVTVEGYNKTAVRAAFDSLKGNVDNGMLRLPYYVQMLQGAKRGKEVADRLYNKVAEAYNRKMDRVDNLTKALEDILKTHNITSWDLSKRVDIPEFFLRPGNREQLFVMLLNMGNEGNAQRVRDNPQWDKAAKYNGVQSIRGDEAAILAMLEDHLEARHFQAAQEIWNLLDTQREALGEIEKRKTGVMPKWVEPRKLSTIYGTFKGGYYPIVYHRKMTLNSNVNQQTMDQAFEELQRGQALKAQTRNGMAQARKEKVTAAIALDFNYIIKHFNDVAQRIEMTEVIDDAYDLATSPVFQRAISETFGEAYIGPEGLLQKLLRYTAVDATAADLAPGIANAFLRNIRIGFSGIIFGTMRTALAAVSSYWETVIPQYGRRIVARGWVEWFGRGVAWTFNRGQTMEELSPFMRERKRLIRREAHDIVQRKVFTGAWSKAQAMAFLPMVMIEKYSVSGPLWWGVYTTSKEQGLSDPEAVQEADKAIANTQGSGRLIDQSLIQADPSEVMKMWTMGMGFASGVYGLQREKLGTSSTVASKLGFLILYYGMYKAMSALAETLIRWGPAAFEPEDEDEEEREGLYVGDVYLDNVMKLYTRNLSVVPLLNHLGSQYDSSTAARDVAQKGLRAGRSWMKIYENRNEYGYDSTEDFQKAVAQSAEFGAYAFGVPFSLQAINSLEAAQQVFEEGEDVYTFENLYKIVITGPDR